MRVLISWLGLNDLKAVSGPEKADDPGPVLRLLRGERFDRVHLLHDFVGHESSRSNAVKAEEVALFLAAKVGMDESTVALHPAPSGLHNDYNEVYEFTSREIKAICGNYDSAVQFVTLLSPGNAAAQVAMLIASQTLFPPARIEVFNTSREKGIERVDPIFRLQADVAPLAFRQLQLGLTDVPLSRAFSDIIGESRAMKCVEEMTQLIAEYDEPVILTGETGTGKEKFARAIHKISSRCNGPIMVVHCAAIAPTLLESELFGHEKGAFTGAEAKRAGKLAQADKGTLFLDEVADIPFAAQVALLRFLNDGTYQSVGSDKESKADVRVIAATHKDLERGVAEGWFREDLYYRLNRIVIALPPLRHRGGDVRLLAEFFMDRFNEKYHSAKRLSDDAVRLLERHPWHGNVRELQSSVARAAIFGPREGEIPAEVVAATLGGRRPDGSCPLADLSPHDFAARSVAVLDELLARFRKPDKLPWSFNPDADMWKDLLAPLVQSRAMELAPNQRQAGMLFQNSGLEMTSNLDRRRVERGCEMRKAIDMALVAQIRGT